MNCMFCGKELYADLGYVTDGVISVCNLCAMDKPLYEVASYLSMHGMSSNIKRVFKAAYTSDKNAMNAAYGIAAMADSDGLTGQTEEIEDKRVELDKSKLNAAYGVAAMASETESNVHLTDEDEAAIQSDIETMSQEDFYSKYADNPDALNAYHDYNVEPSDFLEV